MNKLLTVLVPAYNVEAYLKKNLDSLCRKNVLNDLEVIIVDDGSKDGTAKIADHYQTLYPQTVKVIHKENGGHGSGINCGIAHASGTYFKVVDGDDWVEETAFLNLLNFLKHTESDAVISGFYWIYDNGNSEEHSLQKRAEMKMPFKDVVYGKEYLFDEIADQIYIKMHGLTIKTAVLRENRIQIDEKCFYVDAEYALYPIPYIKTISFIKDFVYMYRIGRHGQSVSPERMKALQSNYDRVFKSLLLFYDACTGGRIDCSEQKRRYIAGGIARVAAGRVKIYLSFPPGRRIKQALMDFENQIKDQYSEIYAANRSLPVKLLRFSRYSLYRAGSFALQMKNRK